MCVADDWWNARGCAPFAGKPLWLTLEHSGGDGGDGGDGGEWRHIFFDDNIHHDANDSIVAVRARKSPSAPFAPVSGEATIALHGSVLMKVPTVRPILDHQWFLEMILRCEARYEALRDGTAATEAGGGLAQVLGL